MSLRHGEILAADKTAKKSAEKGCAKNTLGDSIGDNSERREIF